MAQRVLLIIVTLLLTVAGFFFLVAAVAAGLVVAAVVLVRLWWLKRKLGDAATRHVITTEYTVVERESPPVDRLPLENELPPHPDREHRTDATPDAKSPQ